MREPKGEGEMNQTLTVGIAGDWNESFPSHRATNEALEHAARAMSVLVEVRWLPTPSLAAVGGEAMLRQVDTLWCAPGSPYQSMDGAFHAIRFAREEGRPFIGT
jgi:CTP synthase (UTP-ammonia lyase)